VIDDDLTIDVEDRCPDCGSVFPAHRCTFVWGVLR
jgi:hypothetical protein